MNGGLDEQDFVNNAAEIWDLQNALIAERSMDW